MASKASNEVPEIIGKHIQCDAYCESLSAKLPSQSETDFVEEYIFNLDAQTFANILRGENGDDLPKGPKAVHNLKTSDSQSCKDDECETKCGRNKVSPSLNSCSIRIHS